MSPDDNDGAIYELQIESMLSSQQAESEVLKRPPTHNLNSAINQVSFVLFGCGMLIGQQAAYTSLDFFTVSFPDYKPNFAIPFIISMGTVIFQVMFFTCWHKINLHLRITSVFVIHAIYCIVTVLVTVKFASSNETVCYWTILLFNLIYGASYAFL